MSSFAELGAGGPVGGGVGGAGGGESSSATSSSNGQVSALGSSSAGNRGFINNFAARGASLNADQGINPPAAAASSKYWKWALYGLGGLLALSFVHRLWTR